MTPTGDALPEDAWDWWVLVAACEAVVQQVTAQLSHVQLVAMLASGGMERLRTQAMENLLKEYDRRRAKP